MKALHIIMLLFIATLGLSAAQDRQLFFVAKEDRAGSLSTSGSTQKVVYLRWDTLGSNFPVDIVTFELYREDSSGDVLIYSADAQNGMSATEIGKMFVKEEAQRDLFRTINLINDTQSDLCNGANITNIGEKLLGCLESDKDWGVLYSSENFHIALARHRAYIDSSYDRSLSSVSYRLVGKNSAGTSSIVLGKVTITPGTTQLSLAAQGFEQIRTSKCNDNRYGLDDFRVGLTWKNGGSNPSEKFVHDITFSGYDLYYALESNLDESWAAGVDIRVLARTKSHNANGEVSLLDEKLKKVNAVTLKRAPYYEMQKDLKKRGFEAGESRYYFLVSKDFTGNYGETTYLKVVVPDLLPPPTPSAIYVVEEDVSNSSVDTLYQAALRFDTVNFANYIKSHRDMKVCSTKRIENNTRVHFVQRADTCDVKNGRVVNFNVSNYLIYRFDNVAEAAAFEDRDLDGYNDSDESDVELCSVSSNLIGAKKYLIQNIPQSSDPFITYRDATVQKGKQYWYRVVSVTPSGVSSHMSAPISAYIPKRETLDMPKTSITYKELEILVQNKSSITQLVAKDSAGLSDRVRIDFREGSFEIPLSAGEGEITTELKDKLFTLQPNGSVKVTFFKDIDVVLSRYVDINTLFIFTKVYEKGSTPPPVELGGFQLPLEPSEAPALLGYKVSTVPHFVELTEYLRTLQSGDNVVGGCVDVTFDTTFIDQYKGKACYKSSLKIGNRRYFLEKDCELKVSKKICNETLNGELVSVGVSFVTDSGVQTPEIYVNYVPLSSNPKIPMQPLLENLTLDSANGVVSWNVESLVERASGVIVEVFEQNGESSYSEVVNLLSQNAQESLDANVSGLVIQEGETWCVKGKTIGLNGLLSSWSQAICKEVKSDQELTTSLGWPEVKNRLKRVIRDLNTSYDPLLKSVTITLAKENIAPTRSLVYSRKEQVLSKKIAQDYVLSDVKYLHLKMQQEGKSPVDRVEIKSIKIEKFFGAFYLPANAISSQNAAKVNRLVFTFLDKNEVQIGDSVAIKREGIVAYDYAVSKTIPLSTAFVSIRSDLTNRACIMMPLFDKYTNYVVYRQELGKTLADRDGKFLQVSPLIEGSSCGIDGYSYSKNLFHYSINNLTRVVKFIDRYPYEVGKRYRYMFLFFDEYGEPRNYSLTNPDVIETH